MGAPETTYHLIHASVPGRVRYGVPSLRRNATLANRIERTLAAKTGVLSAHANPRTGSVLLHFRSELSQAEIAALIQSALERAQGPESLPQENGAEELAWHALDLTELKSSLDLTDLSGLSDSAAALRRQREGPNLIRPKPRRNELSILLDQLASVPVAMLGASAVLSTATGGVSDGLAMLLVLGLNAGIGYATESGAERSIAQLTQTTPTEVPVWRENRERRVAVEDVVRGDLLLLHAGVFVAADARVLEVEELTVDESSLTGESVPVQKSTECVSNGSTPLAERTNMVFRGTLITGGSGRALVIATGESTQVGRIQALVQGVENRKTPLQQQLDQLGGQLAIGAGVACVTTAGLGLLRGQALLPMFRTAISLAVAAVPEGLPTVAMTTLALGLRRLRGEQVMVRQLAAVETLGAVQVVCLDKTGTITENRMTAVQVQAGLDTYRVEAGSLSHAEDPERTPHPEDLQALLRVSVLCNEVELQVTDQGLTLLGSPTERALVQLALDVGWDVNALRARSPLSSVQRRAQTRSYMTTRHRTRGGPWIAVKGRPSEVLSLCSTYWKNGERHPLLAAERARIETHNERMAGCALRVLGMAMGEGAALADELPAQLVWVGLVGIHDPPRKGVAEVLARLHRAGIRTVMITGDQSATAQAVAREIGLSQNGHIEIVDSTRLDRIEPEVLRSLARRTDVFSRVSPAHKLQIVKSLQDAGFVVAMTGDGVNDGPALKAADIGIAMGGAGTNVAREISDVVLETDQLAALLTAVEQGRTIYDDIRKAVHFILATNLAEILYTATLVVAGFGEPLTPMQLLWINLLSDVFPELALSVLPPESDVLAGPPRDPRRPMFDGPQMGRIAAEGCVITVSALGAYWTACQRYPRSAPTVGFSALTFALLLHAISARSETHSIFDHEPMQRDLWLPVSLSGTSLLQAAASLAPALRKLLGTVPMPGRARWIALGFAVLPLLITEASKVVLRPPARLPSPVAPRK